MAEPSQLRERGRARTSRGRCTCSGQRLEQADRWDEAKAELETAMKLEPDNPLLLNFLGYGKLERGEDLDAAEAMIRKASALRPDDASITDSLGWALYQARPACRGDRDPAARRRRPSRRRRKSRSISVTPLHAGRRYEARFAWQAALVTAEDDGQARLEGKIDAGLTPPPPRLDARFGAGAGQAQPGAPCPRQAARRAASRWRPCSPSARTAIGSRRSRRTICRLRVSGHFRRTCRRSSDNLVMAAARALREACRGRRGRALDLNKKLAGCLGHRRRVGRRGGGAAAADAAVENRPGPCRGGRPDARAATCPPAC